MSDIRPSDISVVICAYNDDRWDDLVAAVESVHRNQPHETIVVVDHNPALLLKAQQTLAGTTAVPNQEARGLGGARNTGVKVATGKVVAFLDDDAVATPDWLHQLAAAYVQPNALGVGGAIEPLFATSRPPWFPEEFDWVLGCVYRGMPQERQPVRNLLGCNMSFRRSLFAEVGDFQLGYGCDETEFCIRAQRVKSSGVFLYEPHARVCHRVASSRLRWAYFRSRCYFEGGSKAVVSWLQGSRDGLSSERSYTFRTLPVGVGRGLRDWALRHDRAGLQRAGAIVAGFAFTASGYAVAKLSVTGAARRRGWSGLDPVSV